MKRIAAGRRAGFTLVELLVVVLIIGILGAIMIPGYNKSVESSKADDAAAVVMMVGQSNRMFRVDNNNFVNNGTLTNSCNGAPCTAGSLGICQLVGCNYLGSREWDSLSYQYRTGGCGLSQPPGFTAPPIACAVRIGGQPPYSTWGYVMDSAGIVYRSPDNDTTGPPKPVK